MTRLLPLLALLGCEARPATPWPGAVEARTMEAAERFRTDGPSRTLIAGPDTILTTLGYYCSVGGPYWDDPDYPILSMWDGLFLRLAQDSATFADIRSRHSFPDTIRLAVDTGELRPMESRPAIENANGYIHIPSWSPPTWSRGIIAGELFRARSYARLSSLEAAEEALWREIFEDSISSYFVGKDSLRVQILGDTLAFSLSGFATALDSVRARCPADQSIRDWNRLRSILASEISGLRDTILVSLATLSQTEIGDHGEDDIAAYAYLAGMAPLQTTNDIRRLCALHRRVPLDPNDFPGVTVPRLNWSLDFYCEPEMLNHILR